MTMSFNSNSNLYSLDLVDVAALNEFVAKTSIVITWTFYFIFNLVDLIICPKFVIHLVIIGAP